MKKAFIISLLFIPFAFLHSQVKFGDEFGSFTITTPTLRGLGSGGSGGNSGGGGGSTTSYSIPSSVVLGDTYHKRADSLNKLGIESWKAKDWTDAARKFRKAWDYTLRKDPNIRSNLDHVLAYEESDKADKMFDKKDWGIKEIESAIKHYKNAQKYLPNDKYINGCIHWDEGLKNLHNKSFPYAIQDFQNAQAYFKDEENKKRLINNITIASYRQVRELGNNYLSKGDWVNAAAYIKVANKDFDFDRDLIGFSKAYNEVGKIPGGYYLYNKKVEEIKSKLPAEVKKNW